MGTGSTTRGTWELWLQVRVGLRVQRCRFNLCRLLPLPLAGGFLIS